MSIPHMCAWSRQGKLCLFHLCMQQIPNLNNVIVGGPVTQNGIRNGLICCALLLSDWTRIFLFFVGIVAAT